MTDVLAFVSSTASATVLNTGTASSNRWPPFPGVTPATTLVPYAIICLAWNEPSRPVIPCTTRRVDSSMKMLMPLSRWPCHGLLNGVIHVGQRREAGFFQDVDRDRLVRSDQAN